MKVSLDFWKSKVFWTALIATLALVAWAMVVSHRRLTEEELRYLVALWMAVFVRDTVMKTAEIQAGVREPISKEPTSHVQ